MNMTDRKTGFPETEIPDVDEARDEPRSVETDIEGFEEGAPARAVSVSVILPTYNRAPFLAAAIHSILDQSFPLTDIVVVDDGSKDDTAEVVAEFGPRVTYIHQENSGKLGAIERGLDHVQGDLVWIMDDDDLADPRAVEALARPFVEDSACVMSYGRMSRFIDGEEELGSDTDVPYPTDDARPFFAQLMEDCFVTGHPCVLTRRASLEALRPFRPDVHASVDYYLYLGVARTGKSAFIDRHVLRQRQHAGERGPAESRYGESERNQRWVDHDQTLIAPLLRELPTGAYIHEPNTPGYAKDTLPDPMDQRRALLQKAVIAARKKLWAQALDVLHEASEVEQHTPLEDAELNILSGMLGCRYGIDEVHEDPGIPAALREVAGQFPDSTTFLVALARPLLHQIKIAGRERDPSRARKAIVTWNRLLPPGANVAALTGSVRRNVRRYLS